MASPLLLTCEKCNKTTWVITGLGLSFICPECKAVNSIPAAQTVATVAAQPAAGPGKAKKKAASGGVIGGVILGVIVLLFWGCSALSAGGTHYDQQAFVRATDGKVYFTVDTGTLPTYCDVSAPGHKDVSGREPSTVVYSFTEPSSGTFAAYAQMNLDVRDYDQPISLVVKCS